MLLYDLDNQTSVTGFIEFLGVAEPDQVVSGFSRWSTAWCYTDA